MRVPRLLAGAVCLGLAGFVGWWAWDNRVYYEKIGKRGRQHVPGAEFLAKGPRDAHSVRLDNVEIGEPMVLPRGPNEPPAVWFGVYPARDPQAIKGPPKGTPKILYHTRDAIPSKAAAGEFRQRSEVTGTVMNGLPGGDVEIPKEVLAAHPNIDPATVWYVRGDPLWQERGIYWAGALTAILGIAGLGLIGTGLFGRPDPKQVREARRLPALRPLDAKTVRKVSRGYYHAKCGSNTLANGDDLVRLECPFRGCSGTFCCGCNAVVPLSAVQWDDTGERIDEYRERIASAVPVWKRLYLSWLGSAYQGAVNLGLDATGGVVQPLIEPPGGRVPLTAPRGLARSRR